MKGRSRRRIKKRLEHFIKDETGFISKENILKIGLGAISALGVMGAFSSNLLAATHANHNQHVNNLDLNYITAKCIQAVHASHVSHASHGQY